ncbi:MAG: YgiT-type zinc finger protein [Caldilineaceae bacterium SB0661_bin_32]|uniref:YgiT-type zinc finger protein n=1 Tax=Caldilineaceae bacterium SB0661_bin_32 TaxID=2605255 RepID=A0A6B1DDZ9_9CHLR|nr:YgiT-type zinc finger protein [Caldilineaceae bacterium SB0661_bin_32]
MGEQETVRRRQRSEVTVFTCAVCHAQKCRDELVTKLFQIDGQYVLVERIPAVVCVRCGEESFSRDTTEKIRLIVHGQAESTKSIAMPVFEFA